MAYACPTCGVTAASEATELGIFLTCPTCGLEWVEGLPLDFVND